MKENHRRFLVALMGYERQPFLNAHLYERTDRRVDQANGFYGRALTTRLGCWSCACPEPAVAVFTAKCCRVRRRSPPIQDRSGVKYPVK
jgi:hypothetical protein